jgi:hypothetical protein
MSHPLILGIRAAKGHDARQAQSSKKVKLQITNLSEKIRQPRLNDD